MTNAEEQRLAAGGYEGAECLTLDFSPHRETACRWRRLPECDEFVGARRSKHTMVSYKGAIYVFGGDNGKAMLNDTIRYDPADNSWGRAFTMGQLPAPRYHHTAVVLDCSMYVFGGYTGDIHSNSNLTNKNDLFEYKFNSGQWSEHRCEGRLPPARSAHGAAVYNGQMWIFGGFDGHTRLNDMWCISLRDPLHRWEEITQLGEAPPPCCNFAVTVVKDSLYLFSGQSGAKSTNYLFRFYFASRTWTRICTDHILRGALPLPERRYGHTMVSHNHHLYVFGGAADSIHSSDLHCYDLESSQWTVVRPVPSSKVPSGRLFHSAVVIGGSMHVFGGTVDNNCRVADMYKFVFANYPRCTLHDDFGRLLVSHQLCDLRFFVGNDRVPILAHVAIVAARSAYLCEKLKRAREEQKQNKSNNSAAALADKTLAESKFLDITLPDAEPFAFEMVLDYMYTDKIDPTQRGQEPMSCIDVYRLALQFSMKRLERLCIQYLESMIDLRNVLAALQNAGRLNLQYIKEYCLRFITKESHYNQIVMTKEFETIDQPLMVEIIRHRQQVQLTGAVRSPLDTQSVNSQGMTFQEDMRNFLEDGVGAEFCDLTLICQEVSINVHKVILAARSAYFEAYFRSFMPETHTVTVKLGEVVPSVQAFKSLLRFIYYGCTDMPPEDSLFLFSAPAFYHFANHRLQAFCKENLETNIRCTNVLDVLEAAHQLQAAEMKRHALKIIVAHFGQVSRMQKMQVINRELLLDIIRAVGDRISVSSSSAANGGSRAPSCEELSMF